MRGRYIDSEVDTSQFIKGDFACFKRSNGTRGIIYCCPQCGKVSAGTDKHIFNGITMSCTPSLVHECGWHKTLTNGEYR